MEKLILGWIEKYENSLRYVTPSFFSFSRLPFVPFIIWSIASGYNILAIFLFSVAMFTDFLDGFFARLLKSQTKFGSFLDPLCDKLVIIPTVWLLVSPPNLGLFVALAIAEGGLVFIRIIMMAVRCNPEANIFGKTKTCAEVVWVVLMLLGLPINSFFIILVLLAIFSLLGQVHHLTEESVR
ncbi:MAG: CDP-alcohol phosphatidyltransferase family protein [Patescibacteria group bacterium]